MVSCDPNWFITISSTREGTELIEVEREDGSIIVSIFDGTSGIVVSVTREGSTRTVRDPHASQQMYELVRQIIDRPDTRIVKRISNDLN